MRFDLYDIYYLRLSKEDGDVTDGTETESCSIHSQRTCIHHYIQIRVYLQFKKQILVNLMENIMKLHFIKMKRLIQIL